MSGKPNPEGVKTLHQYLKDFYWTRDRIAELEKSIAEQKKTLDTREIESRNLFASINEQLRAMDVASSGNTGYEQRRFELLLMMAQL